MNMCTNALLKQLGTRPWRHLGPSKEGGRLGRSVWYEPDRPVWWNARAGNSKCWHCPILNEIPRQQGIILSPSMRQVLKDALDKLRNIVPRKLKDSQICLIFFQLTLLGLSVARWRSFATVWKQTWNSAHHIPYSILSSSSMSLEKQQAWTYLCIFYAQVGKRTCIWSWCGRKWLFPVLQACMRSSWHRT